MDYMPHSYQYYDIYKFDKKREETLFDIWLILTIIAG